MHSGGLEEIVKPAQVSGSSLLEYCKQIPDYALLEAKSSVGAYANAFKQLLRTPVGRVVKDAVLLVPDAIHYITNGKTAELKEIQVKKVVSGAVALGEIAAMTYGARIATSLFGEISHTVIQYHKLGDALQAVAGSFVGSEGTAAGVLFLVYGGLTTLYNVVHAHSVGDLRLKSTLSDSGKVVKKSFKEGIRSFACADIPISIGLSFFVPPVVAATFGAIAGMLVYTHRVKSSLDKSIDEGQLGK